MVGDDTCIDLTLVYFINVSVTMSASTIIGNFELNITMSSDSSQNSDMTEDQLDKMVNDTRPKSTQRSTDWGIRKFQVWCEKRSRNVDIKTVSATELNEHLRKFYAEVRLCFKSS